MASTFDHADQARAALAAIVADPEFGPAALSSPATLSNLLSDYLPDSPRETGPLLAAAQADVAGTLRDHARHGMDPATAIRITASSLASRTAFSAEACLWVTGELAIALGLTTADRLPVASPTSQGTDVGRLALQGGTAGERPVPDGQHEPPTIAGPQTQRPAAAPVRAVRRKRATLAATVAVVVLAAAAGSAALYLSRKPPGTSASSRTGRTVPKVSIGTFNGTRPAFIDFSADGASAVTGIRWSTWSASRATGNGTWDHNTCIPDCAGGLVRKYPAALTFSQVRHGRYTVLTTVWDRQTLTWRYPGSWPQEASATPVRTSQPSPQQVVEAYIAAVNQHDWKRVWQLGGKNLGASYRQLVAGYRHTSRVVIQSLSTSGQVVTVRVLAYETNGAAQTYRLKYVVSGGIIVAGSSTLLRTSG